MSAAVTPSCLIFKCGVLYGDEKAEDGVEGQDARDQGKQNEHDLKSAVSGVKCTKGTGSLYMYYCTILLSITFVEYLNSYYLERRRQFCHLI